MIRLKAISFLIFSGTILISGCSTTKSLPPNEKLYTGASVSVSGPALTTVQRKSLTTSLKGLTRPKPNTKILGIPLKLSIYNLFAKKKEKSFWGKLRSKYGEPPVFLSAVDLEKNTQLLQNYMENKGYFHAKVTGDTVVKGKTGSAKYKAEAGNQYLIRNVNFPSDTSELAKAIADTKAETLFKEKAPFDLDVIKAERLRIDAHLKERGFYFFNPEYLLIQTDSTVGNSQVDMYLTIKEETPDQARRIYNINDVYIYAGYNLNSTRSDTLKSKAVDFKGYKIIDPRNRYKPYLFEETMQFQPGDVYNRTEHNLTLSRLINLGLFKFVKNRFEPVPSPDTPRLDAYYYLTPLPSKSLRGEATLITRSNNLNGSQFNVSLINRNLFRSGVQSAITAYVGSDVQFSGAFKGYNTYRTGAEASLVAPRFSVPFLNLRQSGPYAPRTSVKVGYDILNRKKLYTLNSYRFEYGYSWKKNVTTQQEFYPIAISYVQALHVTPAYDSLKRLYIGLERAIEPQFILGSRYEYLYNGLANNLQPKNAFFFNGIADISGNVAGLLSGANAKKGDTVKIRNAAFAQYIKLEGDFRYYRKVGLKSTWVNRIDIGYGLPYGNSTQIPYIKQFFSGGNNSLRGFRSRSVGPGTFSPIPTTGNPSTLIPDQTGDIKLELNSEFRPHITGPLYGAVFIDAGNIWLHNPETDTQKPGAQFTSKFLNQLAIDAGVGARLDITIFVIRLDVAFPLRKPWQVPPSVINQVDFFDQPWRKQNVVYNLAIGYPF